MSDTNIKNIKSLTVDNKIVAIEGERNILEVVRKAGIEVPTFCYNPELSIYGSCRMCLVDCAGMGLVAACSTPPRDGMVIKTNTEEIREIRKTIIELLLANHSQNCYTCAKSTGCALQGFAKDMGIGDIRFKRKEIETPKQVGVSLVRDPNKCILCGQCVRMCYEVQGIGAIDFGYRGSSAAVLPAFNKNLDDVECVGCGQCAQVCPTGALMIKSDIEQVWKDLSNKDLTVVVQIAPAVRVAIGEEFGLEAGDITTGKMVSALKTMGFSKVFDTSYSADLTILEEATEFLGRVTNGGELPLFTSCCPAWVKFTEEYYPEMTKNLSSCKSPQQMLGAVIKAYYPTEFGIKKENLRVVSIMPCTAKKAEAAKDKFKVDGMADVDFVLTTQELAQMIKESGMGQSFKDLENSEFDMPFGEKTGAGVIFANSGGVTEAVLRYVSDLETKGKKPGENEFEFQQVRGMDGIREATITLNGSDYHIAIVSGLANARKLVEDVKAGKSKYHFIEVMTCPAGCVAGGGQPVSKDRKYKVKRTQGIFKDDRSMKLHKPQQNAAVQKLYKDYLQTPGSHEAHEKLHTHYNDENLKKKYGINEK